jgi:hypothetical protein
MTLEDDPVVLDRRRLAPHHMLEVVQVELADLPHVEATLGGHALDLLHVLPQPDFGLGTR